MSEIVPLILFGFSIMDFHEVDLLFTIVLAIKGIAILSVLAALSRLAFILGKSFMVESIRNGDRIHAISFGKFFIQAYGNKATCSIVLLSNSPKHITI